MAKSRKAAAGGHAILERGDLFYFYHPKLGREPVHGPEDVASFHLVLHPRGGRVCRYAAVSLKGLLDGGGGHGWWARIERVEDARSALRQRLLGKAPLPAARPCGEGVYALVRHGRHTHLAHALELPEEPGEVQAALGIPRLGNPYVAVRNPFFEAVEEAELSPQIQFPDYPPELLNLFGKASFLPADPVSLLDYAGVEFLMAGGPADGAGELGVDLKPQHETLDTSELFRVLGLKPTELSTAPLMQGRWA